MRPRNHLVIACVCALAAWMPLAGAQERSRHETRSGVLEFEANGYPTDDTVRRIQEEIDYQRAVQAYIHFVPAVEVVQLWSHLDITTRLHPPACARLSYTDLLHT